MSNDPIQMAIEVWRPVPNYESNYEISDFGNLRNIKTGRLIRPTYTGKYYQYELSKFGNKKKFSAHRLVAGAFIGYSKLMVDHLNGNKLDNRLVNLEYVNARENMIRAQKRDIKSGVYLTKNNRYRAGVSYKNRMYFLGTYDDEDYAHEIYCTAVKILENSDESFILNNINNLKELSTPTRPKEGER